MKLNWITKLVSIAVLSAGIAAIASAQAAGPSGGGLAPSKRAQNQGQRHPILDALAKLDLTADQKTKIKALEKTRNEDVAAFRKAHQGDKEAIKAHVEEATKTFLEGIKGVLTPAQWEQFQQALKAMRKDGKNGNGAGTGGAGGTPPTKS